MSRPGQTRPCSRADAQTRLRAASQFLTMCDLGDDDASIGNDVVATNAIHAAIAADAICCARLKLHSASGNHQDAATLLGTVDRKLGDDLARVLGLKNDAAYGTRSITDAEVNTCRRLAGKLHDAAGKAVQAANG